MGEGVHGKAFEFHSRAVKHVMRVRSDGCCRGFFFLKRKMGGGAVGGDGGGGRGETGGGLVGRWVAEGEAGGDASSRERSCDCSRGERS